MQCLDERKLKNYLSGALPAGEIVSASEHVRGCEACRAQIAGFAGYAKAAYELGSLASADQDCPQYETLSAYASEELSGVEYLSVERHITNCELCWDDVETLQEARSRASLAPSITVTPQMFGRKRSVWTVLGWKSTATAAIGVAAVAAVLVMSSSSVVKSPQKPTAVATNEAPRIIASAPVQPKKTVIASVPSTVVHQIERPVVTHRTPRPEPVAVLKDGSVTVDKVGGKVRVKSGGRDLVSVVAAAVEKKLRTGKLPADMQVAMLDSDDMVRGPQGTIEINKISPKPASIAPNTPSFKWEAVDGADKYRVEVSKLDGTTALYEETSVNEFQSTKALTTGYYKWTVWVRLGEYAEWNPSQAIWFRVLSKNESDLLSGAKARYSDSHLVMGTVYEKLGMNDEAQSEFKALVRENPNSKLARKMLDGVRQ